MTKSTNNNDATTASPGGLVDMTDAGNCSLLLAMTEGNLRFVTGMNVWIFWTGKQWVRDVDGTIFRNAALAVAEHYRQQYLALSIEASNATETAAQKVLQAKAKAALAWATQCRNKPRIAALEEMSKKHKGFPIADTLLDTKPHLLGVANGVVDMRTGELKPDARDDFVTMRSKHPFNPKAKCPRWQKFIAETSGTPKPGNAHQFVPRPDLEKYRQVRAGYWFTGEMREQKMFNDFGSGANGKNVEHDRLMDIAGPYGYDMPTGVLEVRKWGTDADRASPSVYRMMGKRMGRSAEWKKDMVADEAVVKRLTGETSLTARDLNGKLTTFPNCMKTLIPSNVAIDLAHADAAIAGRFHITPYSRRWNRPGEVNHDPRLPDGDGTLAAALAGESEGILAWIVAGAVMYYADGLKPPSAVINSTREYLASQDPLTSWLAAVEHLPVSFTFAQGATVDDAYDAFKGFCNGNGQTCGTKMNFSKAMAQRVDMGQVHRLTVRDRVRYGIKLRTAESAAAETAEVLAKVAQGAKRAKTPGAAKP